ncbi:Myb-like DNA-binding domain containing protein [Coccidioides posadasii C735 delta SOWgp]|uniref:Myb-like DNA-binding domain containing protein n=1 Tax=Coccidioides posadasii (strain C735) TaxID=222929 RepID=C5P274_COCP7|nr:Myb-like DNA-binding domain containing protein [Coccidioides posadasii C735 delta SOWgp]EER28977.1 Myb-like DNA-binding domain containing protein [Coccidioides posadasii C735 delta SOWgp]|eukprot:XP_003071122.1 Myb-like DNA-binding domain containing protein [Coccidioides posadasii C735 delta SOWgp]
MASFSSSVINKSGKKFAPKIPARRAPAPSTTPAPPARDTTLQPSQASQISSQARSSPPATARPAPASSSTPVKSPEHAKPSAQPSSPSPRTRRSPASPKAVRIPLPSRRSSVSTAPQTQSSTVKSPSQKPTSLGTGNAGSTLISTPRADAQGGSPAPGRPSFVTLDITETPALSDSQTSVRPAKRIRVSEPETRILPPSRREAESQAIAPTASAASVTPSVESTTTQDTEAPVPATKKTATSKKSKAKRKRVAENEGEECAEDSVSPRKPRGRRKREETPENAESIEIVSAVVKMSDLCRDLRTGRKSKREMELRSMEVAEFARKQRERESREQSTTQDQKKDTTERQSESREQRLSRDEIKASGPQMRIVNGEIVLDTSSLQMDRHADAARNAEEMEEVVENPLTRRINQASFGKRTRYEAWDEELTDLFYKGLRMFGTDFMMISKMFPGRTRRHIKLKFCNEERKDPERIKETLLGPREAVDLDAYSEMTNTVYDDPKVIHQELEEEKKRIEQQHAKEREAREEQLRNPGDGNVLPSIENGADTKRGRSQKKKQAKSAQFGGGTEEILGTIDDF